jgi:hypothetical protein
LSSTFPAVAGVADGRKSSVGQLLPLGREVPLSRENRSSSCNRGTLSKDRRAVLKFAGKRIMPVYQCFLIDSADKVQEVDTIESSSEADAVSRGEHMLRGASYAAAIEVWEHGRLIRDIEREDFQRVP